MLHAAGIETSCSGLALVLVCWVASIRDLIRLTRSFTDSQKGGSFFGFHKKAVPFCGFGVLKVAKRRLLFAEMTKLAIRKKESSFWGIEKERD